MESPTAETGPGSGTTESDVVDVVGVVDDVAGVVDDDGSDARRPGRPAVDPTGRRPDRWPRATADRHQEQEHQTQGNDPIDPLMSCINAGCHLP